MRPLFLAVSKRLSATVSALSSEAVALSLARAEADHEAPESVARVGQGDVDALKRVV